MRGLAQALLLAPALVAASPSRMDEKVKDASPSTFVTFDIPPGFDEDKPQPYTLHLEVLDAPSPCAYPNMKVNDNPLSQGGHTLGRGTFAGDHDGSTFIASWTATCAGDEQLLRFNLESLAGRSLASEVGFVARFRQINPATIIEVAGPVRVSDSRPKLDESPPAAPAWERHKPRPGDEEDRLLEDPPFPPPPHHHVGNHREGDDHHGLKDGSGSHSPPPPPPPPHHSEEVEAKLRELDCLRHQLHALKHKIHEKESRLAHEHGIRPRPHRHALRDCDSLKCVLDILMHRVGGGFRGGFHGFGGRRRGPHGHRHGPPPTCGGPSGHGNHTHGNHTLPPPPPGFCHCGPPPPEGDAPHHGPPPPFDEPPHQGPHDRFDEPPRGPPHGHGPPPPPPPPPFDEPPHQGHHGPGLPPPDDQEHPLGPHDRRPHPHGTHHHGPPPGPHGVPLFAKITGAAIILLGLALFIRARLTSTSASARRADRRARRQRRRDAREAHKAAFTASLPALWTRMFASARADSSTSDEEKQAFLSGGRYRSNSAASRADDENDEDDSYDEEHSMSQEIVEFRNAATMVTEMVAAEEARERRQMMMAQRQREQQQQQHQDHFAYQHQQRQLRHPMNTPPSPTTAFADYMVDDALPTYDEAAPSVVVSDGFSSYTPGSSDYTPSTSDGPADGIDDVLGDTATKN